MVMVKMFTSSVILSEVWTRKLCVTSDLKAEWVGHVMNGSCYAMNMHHVMA